MAVYVWSCILNVFLAVGLCEAQFTCHCSSGCPDGEYDPVEYCHDGCQSGYFDRYCQTKNVAFNKTAWQISTFSENLKRAGLFKKFLPNTADRAVDGNANTFYSRRSCTHTGLSETSPFWAVNLGKIYTVYKIVLYQRSTLTERLTGFEILVDGIRCYHWTSSEAPPIRNELKCERPIRGQNVTIRLPLREDRRLQILTLCEVLILVCNDYWFGEECDRTCHCRDPGEICHPVTGHCESGCPPGYTGDGCMRRSEDNSTRGHVLIRQITLGPALDTTPSSSDNHLSSGDITAIFFGMLIAVFLTAAVVFGYRRWRSKRDTFSSEQRYADLSNRPATTEHLYVGIDITKQHPEDKDKEETNLTLSDDHYEYVGDYHDYLKPVQCTK